VVVTNRMCPRCVPRFEHRAEALYALCAVARSAESWA